MPEFSFCLFGCSCIFGNVECSPQTSFGSWSGVAWFLSLPRNGRCSIWSAEVRDILFIMLCWAVLSSNIAFGKNRLYLCWQISMKKVLKFPLLDLIPIIYLYLDENGLHIKQGLFPNCHRTRNEADQCYHSQSNLCQLKHLQPSAASQLLFIGRDWHGYHAVYLHTIFTKMYLELLYIFRASSTWVKYITRN